MTQVTCTQAFVVLLLVLQRICVLILWVSSKYMLLGFVNDHHMKRLCWLICAQWLHFAQALIRLHKKSIASHCHYFFLWSLYHRPSMLSIEKSFAVVCPPCKWNKMKSLCHFSEPCLQKCINKRFCPTLQAPKPQPPPLTPFPSLYKGS